ncbi:ABC transporter permease [Phytohabitans sp. ZYX-F-186]|uniref:ABC transporter permease n=1 Tax=Phytohabitans maris TaxID=3071409 RepID=A0ABU0ZBF0_9ACTN|nr:ABC transporter permease [Phytohabitans sp. ZYX-F-186]MDQ7903681.1 ABC transporter permease [Phytohabitans sp. ZYX-F-186]
MTAPATTTAPPLDRPPRNRYLQALTTAKARFGLTLVLLMVAIGVLGPLLLSYGPEQQSGSALTAPGGGHPLGTDEVGRDILARVLHGIRTDLVITLVAVPIAAVLGTALGLVGVLSRLLAAAVQRLFDVLLGVPVIILGVGLALAAGAGVRAIIVAVVLATLPTFGRQAHSAVNSQLGREYVTAAVVIGTPRRKILSRHVLPNVVDGMVALAAVSMATAVTIEGGLSVMGLGVVPPQPSLGSMIRDGSPYLFDQPQYALVPVTVVVLLVLGYTLLADALNAAVLRK